MIITNSVQSPKKDTKQDKSKHGALKKIRSESKSREFPTFGMVYIKQFYFFSSNDNSNLTLAIKIANPLF